MSEHEIEVQGADVEAAIEAGLQQLGLSRSDVIVEVVDEGRKGILGLGSKEAVVRLTPLSAPPRVAPPATDTAATSADDQAAAPPPPARKASEPRTAATGPGAPTAEDDEAHDEELERVVGQIVDELLQKMSVENATLNFDRSDPDDKTGRRMTMVRIEGENLSSLIGPHGETLNNLQYIARLMAGHALRRRADFVIDVDGYRSQRKESLSSLARRMAQKAVERGSAVTLEPMSSYDRRIIHMALRDRDDVYTSSVGEGANRRVRVMLKDRE